MFELYRNYNSDGTAFNFGAVDGYTNQGINNTFFQYYLGQDRNRLTEPGRLLENKTINVKDTNETNGVCKTHFIANIDFLITLFTDINNGVENVNENRSWTTMDWYEGFGTLAEGGSVGNGHTLNKAVDFLNIQVTNANGGSEYMTAKQQYDLIKYFRDTGHYRWKEWKKGKDRTENNQDDNEWAGGYHLGLIGNDICVLEVQKKIQKKL